MKTLEQTRAQITWKKLDERFSDDPNQWRDRSEASVYLGALKKTPGRIHSSGLGQALVFLKSRKEQAAKDAYSDLSEMTMTILTGQLYSEEGSSDLLAKIRDNDSTFLFLATEEVTCLIDWLCRYLEGAGVTGKEAEEAATEAAETEETAEPDTASNEVEVAEE